MPSSPQDPSLQDIPAEGYPAEITFALLGRRNDHYRLSGSAVAIAPRLLLTAAHNVSDFVDHFGVANAGHQFPTIQAEVHALHTPAPGTRALWRACCVWSLTQSDLALLLMSPSSIEAKGYTAWERPVVTVALPQPGEKITAYGYRDSSIKMLEEEWLQWTTFPTSTCGVVEEVYDPQRDSVMMNFPSFLTNARFEPGMSGGPVLLSDGALCGVVSRGVLADEDHLRKTANASALNILPQFEFGHHPEAPSDWSYSKIFELVKDGSIRVPDPPASMNTPIVR